MLDWFLPLAVVGLAMGALLMVMWVANRHAVPRTVVSRTFWCPFVRAGVTAEFEEEQPGGRRVEVNRCSAFRSPAAIGCLRTCLELAALPEWREDSAAS